jgi:DNA-directed RNA polymerase specialized sigma24 family protein
VTHADLQAYLARKETQKQLRIVVAGVLGRRANRQNVHDLAVDAQVAILGGEGRPESLESMPGWVDGVARNTVRVFFKGEREERKVFVSVAVEGRTDDTSDGKGERDALDGARSRSVDGADAPDESGESTPDAFLLSPWLRSRVKQDPEDRALLELLAYRAKSKKTYAVVAAERGMTVAAIHNRVYRLRKKYEDEWREHKRKRDTLMLALWKAAKITAGVVVAAGIALLLYLVMRPRKDEARPVDDFPPLGPVPTASAAPPDIADPTQPSAVPTTQEVQEGKKPTPQGGKPPPKK